jgi:hypothetical protein
MASMKYLMLLLCCVPSFASTLTVFLSVRENAAPSRQASLYVTDGPNSLLVDLYRTSAYPGQITQLGYYCDASDSCTFTLVGNLTATIQIDTYTPGNSLVLGGIPVPYADWSDYSVWFSMKFTGASRTTLDADLDIAVTQLSTGSCAFCAHAPFGTGTASGADYSGNGYPDYRFDYQASGEVVVPEPGSWEFALLGITALVAAGVIGRHAVAINRRAAVSRGVPSQE